MINIKIKLIALWIGLSGIFAVLNSCSYSSKVCGNLLKKSMTKSYDIVVVPGVPLKNGKWDYVMKLRVYWSKYLYDKGIAKNVIYSGAAVYSPYCEAEVMALYAKAIGIPEEHIFTETKAEHSTENIYYSYKKAKKMGFKSLALASDPFQTKMLRRFTRKIVSADIGLIPVVIDTIKIMLPKMTDPVIEYQKTFVENFVPLTQREGFWKRFRGTRGHDIDTTFYN
jgi:uncharacterized SAM-binding protein YcdF (DUF218 family)